MTITQSMLEIAPKEFERPFLMVSEDGTMATVWGAVEFKADLDPFGPREFDKVRVSLRTGEAWMFFNVRIAPRANGGAFVMVYDSAKKESPASESAS